MPSYFAAIEKARHFVGATAPNPPVGAMALDAQGKILSVQAHEQAGTGHAEAKVLEDLRAKGLLGQVAELFVTLEPCNHQGRTPPCTEAILAAGIRRVIYGVRDPNPRVLGSGAERLQRAGVEAQPCSDPAIVRGCQELLRPFTHWAKTGRPWVVVKTAETASGSMIPPPGHKTFTSPSSLKFAHELRRRADAILTGSGTILADRPELTVRHVPEHELVSRGIKKRKIVVLDRRGRTPADWIAQAQARGQEVWIRTDLESALDELGRAGAIEVLVEAGPTLSTTLLQSSLWNEHVLITQGNPPETNDRIQTRCSQESSSASLP